jgi:pimeloyl-ACP methyl ester carboxylesterase
MHGSFPPRGIRRLREIGALLRHSPRTLRRQGPRGPKDGPPAMVIPGFLAHDRHTTELRRALAEAGFRVFPWREGFNWGARKDTLDRLERALDRCDSRDPVLLVGWSLGGLYARELALAVPDKVRAVVTMGSPVWGDRRRHTSVWRLYEFVARHPVDDPPIPDHEEKPPVPTLALWSAEDGIVAPPSASGTEVTRDSAVELQTTHMGFAMSPRTTREAVREIRNFLRETEGPESAH